MKDEKSSIEFRVGLFVITGLILFVLSLFLLGGDNYLFTSYYRINAKFQEVQGLREGSIVSLSGIKVGNVTKIQFNSNESSLNLALDINENFRDRIREGSQASVRTQGALGDKYIFIEPSGLDRPVLSEGGFLDTSSSGDLLSTIADRGSEIDKVFEILKELHLLLERINGENRSGKGHVEPRRF